MIKNENANKSINDLIWDTNQDQNKENSKNSNVPNVVTVPERSEIS
ncbi:MAG: hypothetical protein K0S30_737 [Clostridia bacterium]|jgi:hypothetical protein|nr:hypothetical protein [Clostridia bacterium]